jgi:2-keto-4-pentenoate hydratase/2-oxohepta-3-ene-1,7-dioic acid hydratase in catechol pathway
VKLVTFELLGYSEGTPRLGVADGGDIIELSGSMQAAIAGGVRALQVLQQEANSRHILHASSAVRLLAPLPRVARNIFCVGKNYHAHAREFGSSGFDASAGKDPIPDYPIFFTKASTTVIGPGMPIPRYLDPTDSVDYEGELAVIIAAGGMHISRAEAMSHVFGYTIINDVTSRILQSRHRQWFVGKNIDGFCPMGPCIVTVDEVPRAGDLRLQTRVNDELRQDALVAQLIFDIPTLIATLSATMTLEPGDIIATGTCAGVGIGFSPPRFLKAGDRVAVTIEPIGTLENEVA